MDLKAAPRDRHLPERQFWRWLRARLCRLSASDRQSLGDRIERAAFSLTGNPIQDMTTVAQVLDVKRSELPVPYRAALNIGDQGMTANFLMRLALTAGSESDDAGIDGGQELLRSVRSLLTEASRFTG